MGLREPKALGVVGFIRRQMISSPWVDLTSHSILNLRRRGLMTIWRSPWLLFVMSAAPVLVHTT